QRRYQEALEAYEEARAQFTALNEPGSVATSWHQTGMTYQEMGTPEAAEDAYRKSLAISVQLGDIAGQANTLLQLGNLYDDALERTEEAVAFYRQAADKYGEIRDAANEGRARNNLADCLRKLHRLDEARQEILRAIKCKAQFGHASEPWTTWGILSDIEMDEENPTAAAEAKQKAISCYLTYRRDGGEKHYPDGRICLAVTQSLLAGNPPAAATLLQQLAADPKFDKLLPFIQTLQAIVSGSRDRSLADDPELDYTMAAEILFLIETLGKNR
ncbi:MAG: tetratricopeptide repeat protein, partial [Nitrospirales bacterium]|nr:tetratricopeptide repeat protein [Nitrospirales bacterium]